MNAARCLSLLKLRALRPVPPRPGHRVLARRRHRLAPRPSAGRGRRRRLAAVALQLPPASQGRGRLGARLDHRRAALGYLMSGPSRSDWQHSIPDVEALRYSVTFRTVRG